MNRLSISILLLFLIICGCNKDGIDDKTIYFVGDSQIANWDVEFYFPNKITKNLGKDGAILNYLNSVKIPKKDAELVVEIGTNDIREDWDDIQIREYVDRFSEIIKAFPCNTIYVLEVFPTSNIYKNRVIESFNSELKKVFSKENRVMLVEVYDALEDNGVIKVSLTRDGLHLNDYGYRIVTNEIQKMI